MNLDKNVKNSEEFSYLVNLALDQKVSWTMLKGFLNELVSSLEASKKLNAVLLDELQSLHSKTFENQFEANHESSVEEQETFNDTEDQEVDAEVQDTVENGSDDDIMVLFTKQETINDEDDLQPEDNLINETHEIEKPKSDELEADQNSFDGNLQGQSYDINELQSVFTDNVDEPVNEPVDNQSDMNSLYSNNEESLEARIDNEKVISSEEDDDNDIKNTQTS